LAKYKLGRHRFQAFWALATNAYLRGFFTGQIYQGKLKFACSPGLNCYSCPASLFSCPIGALQAIASSPQHAIGLYAVGFLIAVGASVGRFVCGYACPFGLLQELAYKLSPKRKLVAFPMDRPLRAVKYIVLGVFVILLPNTVVNAAGGGQPFFCKLLCPAGTLEAGIPLLALNPALRSLAGALYAWKLGILGFFALLAVFVYRPFCRYLCPLGAVYGPFNRIALLRYQKDASACTHCGACSKACPMAADPERDVNSPECVRCGQCRKVCTAGAIRLAGVSKPTKDNA